jgi:putative protease
VKEGKKGERISVPINTKIRRADKLFKMIDPKEVKERK